MSRVVLVCVRDPLREPASEGVVASLNAMLSPDNVTPAPPVVSRENGVATVVLNPRAALRTSGSSVCVGGTLGSDSGWETPGHPAPDGSYAIFRAGPNTVELLADTLASRSIWYILTDQLFVASTSQRAIIARLGSFEANPQAAAWMLSAGCLGPDNGWDARIRLLPPGGRLVLDRPSWRVSVAGEEAVFEPEPASKPDLRNRLEGAIQHTFEAMPAGDSSWVLPLSGGVDSRAILLMLRNRASTPCVTWGLKSSLDNPASDAHIARLVAGHLGVSHRFFATDPSSEPVDRIFDRYLVAGEGRVDHIGGYMDGFAIWKQLFEEGYAGVIRGDEAFGWHDVQTPFDARRSVGCMTRSDYSNLKNLDSGQPPQTLPARLERRRGESLATWRDRLYQMFRVPCTLAALNDLKCAYVELVNPFLSREIVRAVRTLPDAMRTEKALFREIVMAKNPDIPFATESSIARPGNLLRRPDMVEMIRDELGSSEATSIMSAGSIEIIRAGMSSEDDPKPRPDAGWKSGLKSVLRRPITLARSYVAKPKLDNNVLAFRAFLVCRMHRMLSADAHALDRTGREP